MWVGHQTLRNATYLKLCVLHPFSILSGPSLLFMHQLCGDLFPYLYLSSHRINTMQKCSKLIWNIVSIFSPAILILLHIQYCGKVINCIDVGGESSALIAGGGSDPILRIWDPRKPGILSLQMHSLIIVINMHLQFIHTQPLICCNDYFRNSGS